MLLVVFAIAKSDFLVALALSLVINSILVFIYVISSYTETSRTGNTISVVKWYDSYRIQNVDSVESWWSYDFGLESPAINEGSHGKSAGTANKINCFLRLSSKVDEMYLYEQIDLGSKFPNDHEYNHLKVVDKSKLYRVWDIDKCIAKLELESFLTDKE